jgi:WXG100 family type VII secretion target
MIISARFDVMTTTVEQINATWSQIQAEYEQLTLSVDKLLATWSGAAQAAYHAYQIKWNQAAMDLNQALKGIGGGVDVAHENLWSAEQANRQGWGG